MTAEMADGEKTTSGQILAAGIGNIFFGDDGFGVEVANRLIASPSPAGARIAEYGIRGVHLAYELLDGYRTLVLIDAVPMNEPPGTLAVLQPPAPSADDVGPVPAVDSHTMSPGVVLGVLATLGGSLDNVYVVGCQPESIDPGMGLSDTVTAAIEPACELTRQLLADLAATTDSTTTDSTTERSI